MSPLEARETDQVERFGEGTRGEKRGKEEGRVEDVKLAGEVEWQDDEVARVNSLDEGEETKQKKGFQVSGVCQGFRGYRGFRGVTGV